MLMRDRDIYDFLNANPTAISNVIIGSDPFGSKSVIQSSSIDLTIGSIYLPEVESGKSGAVDKPRVAHALKPGHTAVVDTTEELSFPNDISAFGFPPASVSSRGLLMTNPGHVDPGYVGNLTFTVINMGKEPYELRRGDRIVTLLLFKLEHPAEAGWSSRRNNARGLGVTEERMGQLSSDLNVEERAREVAKGEEQKTRIFSFVAPIAIGVLALLVSVYQARVANEQKIQDLSKQVAVLTERLKVQSLDQRVSNLEKTQQRNPTSTTRRP